MPYTIEIKTLPAQPAAVVRRTAKRAELSRVVPDCCGLVWNRLRAAGIAGGRHVAIYYDGVINLEVGAEVNAPFLSQDPTASPDPLICSATPAGLVATTVHMGSYARLHEAHAAIRDYCLANGHRFGGPNWEIYGHWSDDPAQVRTDVFYLLA